MTLWHITPQLDDRYENQSIQPTWRVLQASVNADEPDAGLPRLLIFQISTEPHKSMPRSVFLAISMAEDPISGFRRPVQVSDYTVLTER